MTPDLPPAPPADAAAAPVAAVVAPAPATAPIYVDSHGYRYAVNGNRHLSREAVVAIVEAAPGPQEAIDELRRAYIEAGFFLVALQAGVSNRLVAIEVVHGRITEISASPPALEPYFASLAGREDLTRSPMIRAATMAEIYSARQGMRPRASFAPAAEAGGTKMEVTEEPIEGAAPWSAGLSFGNLGSRYSSRYLAQAAGSWRPGAGLELTASYAQGLPGLTADSAGSRYYSASGGGSIVTPWGLYSATYTSTRYQIGEGASLLTPAGDIGVATFTGTQLLYADETRRWTVNEGFTHTDNNVYVFDESFPLTLQSYDFVSLGTIGNASFAVLGQNASMTAGLTLSRGISPPKGSFLPVAPGVPTTRFTLAQANLNYAQALPAGFSASLSWTGQWSDATLPQNQQWVLGGFGNLSAWLPAVMVGDRGSLLRALAATPSWQWEGVSVAGSAFFEWGLVSTYYPANGVAQNRGASDAGLSLTASYKTGTNLVLAYAWPVSSRNIEISALDKLGRANLYFSLNQSF